MFYKGFEGSPFSFWQHSFCFSFRRLRYLSCWLLIGASLIFICFFSKSRSDNDDCKSTWYGLMRQLWHSFRGAAGQALARHLQPGAAALVQLHIALRQVKTAEQQSTTGSNGGSRTRMQQHVSPLFGHPPPFPYFCIWSRVFVICSRFFCICSRFCGTNLIILFQVFPTNTNRLFKVFLTKHIACSIS